MHTQWLRAFRTASFHTPRRRIITRPHRYFHVSAALRSTASPNGNNTENDSNLPREDESNNNNDNPGEEKGNSTDGQNGEENLFGETTTLNGDSQGRKKRVGNSSLRSRTLRNRTPEELPPVKLPHDFPATAISRLEDAQLVHEKVVKLFKEFVKDSNASKRISASLDSLVSITQKSLDKRETIHRGMTSTIALSYWRAACLTYELQGADAAAKFLESHPAPWSVEAKLLSCIPIQCLITASPGDIRPAFEAVYHQTFENAVLTGVHPIFLEEIIATLRANFAVEAPKKVKVSDLQRPVTVINTSYCKGFAAAQVIVRHIAAELNADVLHLRPHDLAHIIGNYLGQDVVRAPSPISNLAYKAAENNGRSLSHKPDTQSNDEETGLFLPYTQVLREDKLRKESKKSVMTMSEFLSGTSRAKSDDLWGDLKINSLLEELVHTADSDGPEQRPLLVHIDDYNAINMDLEAGSSIIGKIRKVVDGLWVEGRKIAVVGTCSSQGAPKAYQEGLKEIALSERLINLHVDNTLITQGEKRSLKELEEMDCIDQNQKNITDVLLTLLKLNSEDTTTFRAKGLGTRNTSSSYKSAKESLPETWTTRILPLSETYRIATTMIGLCGSDVFNANALQEAVSLIKRIDETKERLIDNGEDRYGQPDGQPKTSSGFFSKRMKDHEVDHEEELLSGLVNAKDIRTTFNHIHAPKETIESIRMLTTLSLIRPEAFSYGVLATERIPGCLLYGPPGTGKTLLAKAVAKESGANMIEVSAATINNMYVGESEKIVRALFRLARKKEPLVIFIDEADALLGTRSMHRDRAGSRGVINQFLREWDGVDDDPSSKTKNKKAFIMVATNRPFDLDEAVLRRLPRKLLIDLPREKDRTAILKIHLRDEELGSGVDLEDLARRTPLYSGSDLKNVCVAAAMAAVKEELFMDPVSGTVVLDGNRNSNDRKDGEGTGEEGESKEKGGKEINKRVLQPRHFDAALKEIGASVSEDMQTLTAIRRFDERYGDSVTGGGSRRKGRRTMGFEVVPESRDSDGARVRVAVDGGERGR